MADDRPGTAGPRPRPLHSDPAVVALLASVLCSTAALMAQVTALGKQVYDLTGRELDLGWLGLAEFAPAALLVLVTGAVADRHERRTVGAWASLAQAAAAGGLALYTGTRPTATGPIFALVFAFGAARAFAFPAIRALPADVVGPDRLPALMPRFSAAFQAGVVTGPLLGGFLYAADPRLPYLASAALLTASAGLLLPVRSRAGGPQPAVPAPPEPLAGHAEAPSGARATLGEAVEGIRLIRRQPVLLGAISLDLFAVLFGGALALLPAIATDRLGVDAVGLGWLRAAGGIGAGAVTLALAARPFHRRVGPTLFAVVAAFGAATVVLGLTRDFSVAFLAMAVLSGADAVSVYIRSTLVPLVTPRVMRGRVMAVESVFIGASNELGAFESGVAGQLLGPSAAVVLGGAATLAVAGAWAVLFPGLRRIDRFPPGEAQPHGP
ncbi:MAG TPA: MFS transporter [Acidimicrobiales bacterium]|nr:MFS transporter [Acidimicrobiales bacterium]